jgi:hypothetical protein
VGKRDDQEFFRAKIGPSGKLEATLALTKRHLILRPQEAEKEIRLPLQSVLRIVPLVAGEDEDGYGVDVQWRPACAWRADLRRLWLPCRDAEQAVATAEAIRAALPRRVMKVRDRRQRLAADLDLFVRQYARKKPKGGGEPNDRDYDPHVLTEIERMHPEDLDDLLRWEFDDDRDEGNA